MSEIEKLKLRFSAERVEWGKVLQDWMKNVPYTAYMNAEKINYNTAVNLSVGKNGEIESLQFLLHFLGKDVEELFAEVRRREAEKKLRDDLKSKSNKLQKTKYVVYTTVVDEDNNIVSQSKTEIPNK